MISITNDEYIGMEQKIDAENFICMLSTVEIM